MHKPRFQSLEDFLGAKKHPSSKEKELFEKTRGFVRIIQWIPGLKMVAVSNSLAMYATHEDSDIDLFIITAPRRLWIVRTLILAMATILGVRTRPHDEAGKFCFPFFMTEKHLNLKPIALENDIYLEYWIRTLKPILIKNYAYGRFMQINAPELSREQLDENRRFLIRSHRRHIDFPFLDTFGNLIETGFQRLFLPRVLKHINSLGNTEGIVITEDMLKLHYRDRRRSIREKITVS